MRLINEEKMINGAARKASAWRSVMHPEAIWK
jgi:hypothetical protein